MKVVFEILWLTLRDLPVPSTGMGPAAPPPPLISPPLSYRGGRRKILDNVLYFWFLSSV